MVLLGSLLLLLRFKRENEDYRKPGNWTSDILKVTGLPASGYPNVEFDRSGVTDPCRARARTSGGQSPKRRRT
jgi:hypothetical protein